MGTHISAHTVPYGGDTIKSAKSASSTTGAILRYRPMILRTSAFGSAGSGVLVYTQDLTIFAVETAEEQAT